MTIRIGANPIGWSNDDMQEIGGWIPLEQCLSEAKAAGFVGMELGNKFPRESAKLRPILDKHGLALIGGWHSIFLIERDAETEFAEAAASPQAAEGHGHRCLHRRRMHPHHSWRQVEAAVDAPGHDGSGMEALHRRG